MNTVQPLRERDLVNSIARDLKEKNERNYLIFMLGIYSGLRISDILKLKVKEIKKKHINIRAKKTGKETRILINDILKEAITDYLNNNQLPDEEYVFKSRVKLYKPIGRVQVYKILNEVVEKYNLDSIGTHTLRKTFGYWHYKQFNDIALLQTIFGHTDQSVTMRYIGINQDTSDTTLSKFKI